NAHRREPHRHHRLSGAALSRPRRKLELVTMGLGEAGQGGEQLAAVGEVAILAGARQKLRAGVRQARPFLVNVALAVVHDGDHRGLAQHRFRLVAAVQPAIGFLLLDRKAAVVFGLALGPPPHLRVDQPEAFLVPRVDREHRMDEQPDVAAIADRAEPPLAPALGLIVDLARVLNGEHVPPRCATTPSTVTASLCRKRRSRTCSARLSASPRMQTSCRSLTRSANNAPFFLSRSSPKYPIPISAIAEFVTAEFWERRSSLSPRWSSRRGRRPKQ